MQAKKDYGPTLGYQTIMNAMHSHGKNQWSPTCLFLEKQKVYTH